MSEFSEIVGQLAKQVSKIKDAYAFAAFALLIVAIALNFSGISGEGRAWLFAALLGTAIIMVALLALRSSSLIKGDPQYPAEFYGLRALVESTNLPMYFTDTNLIIICCNARFAELLNCQASALQGKHLLNAVEQFAERVPKSRRVQFLKDQRSLIGMTMGQHSPHSERVEYLDNRDLIGNSYSFLMRVHIHADKIKELGTGRDLGMFTTFGIEQIAEMPLVVAPRRN